jgi:hypothetical protein
MAKTIKFLPGEVVYYNKEKHVVLFIIPPKEPPDKFVAQIDEAFEQYTPPMLTINGKKYKYQQGGESLFMIKPIKNLYYVIAGPPDKKYFTISIHLATEEQLTSKEEHDNAF